MREDLPGIFKAIFHDVLLNIHHVQDQQYDLVRAVSCYEYSESITELVQDQKARSQATHKTNLWMTMRRQGWVFTVSFLFSNEMVR